VRIGKATLEYGDAKAFFRADLYHRRHGAMLTQVSQRLNGKGGEPVIQLQTAFGGGRTHTLLAVYHLAARKCPLRDLVASRPYSITRGCWMCRRRKLRCWTELRTPRPTMEEGKADHSHSLGELAWQLGQAEGFALVEESDANGTSPGKDDASARCGRYAPCVVLLDELVVYIRQFVESQPLSGGTYDSNLSFIQSLTEAASSCRM